MLTTQERAILKAQLQREGKVSVWMYGAGLIRENATAANMSDLLNMPIALDKNAQSDHIRWSDTDDPLLTDLRDSLLQLPANPAPALTIEEHSEHCRVLARFKDSGKPAIAVRDEPTYSTVYVGVVTAPSAFLRNCARKAGVFLHVDTNEVIQTDGRWLFLTASTAGPKAIRLPHAATVRDAMTTETIGTNIDHWQADFQQGETRVYQLDTNR